MRIFATATPCNPLSCLLERLKMTKFRLLLEFLQFIMQISPYFAHDDKKIYKNSQKFHLILSLKFKRAFQPFANKTHKSLVTLTKLL